MFEIHSDKYDSMQLGRSLEPMLRLSLCCRSLLDDELDAPTCCPLSSFNYYAQLLLTVEYAEQLLQCWAATAAEGAKIRGSDVFVPLDARRPWPVAASAPYPVSLSLPLPQHQNVALSFVVVDNFSVQRVCKTQCRDHRLSPSACGAVAVALDEAARMASWPNLPAVQTQPTKQAPFVFLHLDKCGGTSLRELIFEAAAAAGFPAFVPCHGGVPCSVFAPPVGTAAVLAGHFSWGCWLDATDSHTALGDDDIVYSAPAAPTPACFFMGRHPVDRVVSYYYQRCYRYPSCNWFNRTINNLTMTELHDVLTYLREAKYTADGELIYLDDGMKEAGCRTLLGARRTTGRLVTDIPTLQWDGGEALSEGSAATAAANMQRCVVGVLNRWDETVTVLEHWFPWMNLQSNPNPNRRRYFLAEHVEVRREPLQPATRRLIEDSNRCDMEVHQELVKRFDTQLKFLSGAGPV